MNSLEMDLEMSEEELDNFLQSPPTHHSYVVPKTPSPTPKLEPWERPFKTLTDERLQTRSADKTASKHQETAAAAQTKATSLPCPKETKVKLTIPTNPRPKKDSKQKNKAKKSPQLHLETQEGSKRSEMSPRKAFVREGSAPPGLKNPRPSNTMATPSTKAQFIRQFLASNTEGKEKEATPNATGNGTPSTLTFATPLFNIPDPFRPNPEPPHVNTAQFREYIQSENGKLYRIPLFQYFLDQPNRPPTMDENIQSLPGKLSEAAKSAITDNIKPMFDALQKTLSKEIFPHLLKEGAVNNVLTRMDTLTKLMEKNMETALKANQKQATKNAQTSTTDPTDVLLLDPNETFSSDKDENKELKELRPLVGLFINLLKSIKSIQHGLFSTPSNSWPKEAKLSIEKLFSINTDPSKWLGKRTFEKSKAKTSNTRTQVQIPMCEVPTSSSKPSKDYPKPSPSKQNNEQDRASRTKKQKRKRPSPSRESSSLENSSNDKSSCSLSSNSSSSSQSLARASETHKSQSPSRSLSQSHPCSRSQHPGPPKGLKRPRQEKDNEERESEEQRRRRKDLEEREEEEQRKRRKDHEEKEAEEQRRGRRNCGEREAEEQRRSRKQKEEKYHKSQEVNKNRYPAQTGQPNYTGWPCRPSSPSNPGTRPLQTNGTTPRPKHLHNTPSNLYPSHPRITGLLHDYKPPHPTRPINQPFSQPLRTLTPRPVARWFKSGKVFDTMPRSGTHIF